MTIDRENMTRENMTTKETKAADDSARATLVDTLFDTGLTWAEFGVGRGRLAVETCAKALEKVAQSLGDLQGRLRKGAA